jgi:hypothetical protein
MSCLRLAPIAARSQRSALLVAVVAALALAGWQSDAGHLRGEAEVAPAAPALAGEQAAGSRRFGMRTGPRYAPW